jgi:predicted MFS family arabinose efflux permease
MATLAQGWLVVQLAPRPALAPLYLGIIGFVRAIPVLALSGVAGAVADRIDRRRLLIVTQAVLGLAGLGLAILTQARVVRIWEVVLLAGISACALTFDAPARQSLVPLLVGPRELMNAIGLNSAAFNGPGIVGPALGGVLVDSVGIAATFSINAASFAAVIVALVLMTPKPPMHGQHQAGIWDEVRDGIAYVRGQPAVLTLLSLALLVSVVARPYIQLLPAFVRTVLAQGPTTLGTLMAASGAGALAGSVAVALIGSARHRGRLAATCAAFAGLALAGFAVSSLAWLGTLLLIVLGASIMLFMGMTNTLLQTHTRLEMRGRVMSLYTMIFLGFMPLGAWLLGSLASVAGLRATLAAGGMLVALAAVLAARRSGLRDLR